MPKVIVPKVPSAKVLARYRKQLDAVNNAHIPSGSEHALAVSKYVHEHLPAIQFNPEAKAMLLEAARIHDENEDRDDQVAAAVFDELSPHARAALERLIGKPCDFV